MVIFYWVIIITWELLNDSWAIHPSLGLRHPNYSRGWHCKSQMDTTLRIRLLHRRPYIQLPKTIERNGSPNDQKRGSWKQHMGKRSLSLNQTAGQGHLGPHFLLDDTTGRFAAEWTINCGCFQPLRRLDLDHHSKEEHGKWWNYRMSLPERLDWWFLN